MVNYIKIKKEICMEKESRGLMGTAFKWMLIVFNVMMAIMVYLSIGHTEESNTGL